MATADASIYSQIRPFTMESPLAQAGHAIQIQAGQNQVREQERKFTLEDDISGALAESGGDLSKASTLLAQRGRGNAALQVKDKAAAQSKAELESKLKLMEAVGSDGIALDAAYRDALKKSGGDQAAAVQAVAPVYGEVRARWAQMGHQLPEQFDPVKNLAGIGQAKEVATYLKGLQGTPSDVGKLLAERDALSKDDPRRATYDAAITHKTTNPTELARLQGERDALSPGDPRIATYDRVLEHYKAGKGDTNVMVNTGPMAPSKAAATKIDEKLLETTQGLMQIDQIASQFKPEYQRFQDKAGFAALSVKDSTIGLTNKEKQDVTDFSKYRRNAISQINDYIHAQTGASMGVQEAQRLMKAVPNPGSGLFDGDSPTEFKAKLDDVTSKLKMSVARLSYIKRNGMSLEDGTGNPVVPLERMPTLINERGREIEAQLKTAQPKADEKALQRAVRRQLSVEFGLAND